MAYDISINDSAFQAFIKKIGNVMPGYMAAAGAMRQYCRQYYADKNAAEPNKMGGKRTNFWADIGRSISMPVPDMDGAYIAITHESIWQKVKGGTLVPGPGKKWLTIPANPLAYGKPAGSFYSKMKFVPLKSDLAMFVLKDDMPKTMKWKSQRRTGKGGVEEFQQKVKYEQGTVMFWLKKSVTQMPTPGAVPPTERLQAIAVNAFAAWAKEIKH